MAHFTTLFGLAVTVAVLCLPGARANDVLDWNTVILQSIRRNGTPPPKASRALAILHAAIFDAVNGINNRFNPYLADPGSFPTNGASVRAAVHAAAHDVLVDLFPTDVAIFDTLYNGKMATLRAGSRKFRGMQWGQTVASMMLASRVGDGSEATVAPPAWTATGDWVATAPAYADFLLPQWGTMQPFTMTSSSQFRPPGPPGLNTAEYTAAFQEVKAYGAATGSLRSADQSQIAMFWADGAGTETPPGHWNSIAQTVAAARGLGIRRTARLFALLNLAMADAAISAWDSKFTYHNWRPITAIRAADTDGNDNTTADANWQPLLATPPFPDHTSGHSTFSGAASVVLARFFRTDNIAFTSVSDGLPGLTRSFASFSAAAAEARDSRLFGGIHFSPANGEGLVCGRAIGKRAFENFLRPKHGSDVENDVDDDDDNTRRMAVPIRGARVA